jgi:S1-C subfamily serine protease
MDDLILLDAIERYIRGAMHPDELAHFENLRSTNPEIDQLVVEHGFFLKQLDQYADHKHFKAQLETVHTGLLQQKEIATAKESRLIPFFIKYRKRIAVAATIAALVTVSAAGILFAYHKGKTDNPEYRELNNKVTAVDQKIRSFGNILENVQKNSSKPVIIPSTSGTGFIINENGYLITNNHVVKGNRNIYVYNEKYGDLEAEVVLTDPGNDLAVIKITDTAFIAEKKLPYSFINNDLELGQRIYTLGFSRSNSLVYNEGFISSKAANTALQNKEKFLLTLQVDGGSSGSPVINNNGAIIGIVAAKEVQENGFAVGIKPSTIRNLVNDLNTSLEKKIVLPEVSNMARYTRNDQIKKISDYVFMVKIK